MRNVFLYGHLRRRFGHKFELAVDTPGEAIRLLNANFPGFEAALRKGWYRLVVGDRRRGERLDLDHVEMRLGRADFHLIPVVTGGRKGGIIKAVLGVALVGAAVFFSGGTLAAPLAGMSGAAFSVGSMSISWGTIAGLGLATALMGVSQLISPSEQAETGTDKQDSFAFSGPLNVTQQGYPVPVVIGEVITGGIPISSGFDIENIPVGV